MVYYKTSGFCNISLCFLLQLIKSEGLTVYSYPALLKAIFPKCIFCEQ